MMMMGTLVLLSIAYALGFLSVIVVEVAALLFLIRRLNRKVALEKQKVNESSSPELDPSIYNKQGFVWILESEKVAKPRQDSLQREQKLKKEVLEVFPVQKHAKLKNNSLFISESDGSQTEVRLKGCTVTAVSATNFSSRKWAKRYPIKVESKNSKIYKGCKILYIYLDTSWEKEAWCKVLRLASCDDKEKLKWFTNLNLEFQRYVTSLIAEYPSFMKPSMGWNVDPIDKSIKLDGSSSKVRQFLKKLGKKASKSGIDSKGIWTNASTPEDRKINEKSHLFQDYGPANMGTKGKVSEDISVPSSTSSDSGNRNQTLVVSDVDSDERTFDEGTLCWNILLSRLFFDAKCNMSLKTSMQARIQRMLSNMRSPSFIGDVTCTAVDPGNIPPYIHAMRVLPAHMNELWAFEIDLEYSGDAILNVETRLEVQELDLQEGEGTSLESSGVGEVTSDLLEGIEYYGKQLNLSEGADELLQRDEGEPRLNGARSHKSTIQGPSQMSKWKCMLQSLAKQVSQVPISLGIRVSSFRGTMRVYMKSPPSDQIWFGFLSMPDIDFNLEPFVGDHKITSGRLALFLINRFKLAIRETLVLPNCESICIPWMLAEKDDWVPQKVAPFIWIKNEATATATSSSTKQGNSSQSVEEKIVGEIKRGASNSSSGDRQQKTNKAAGHVIQLESESSDQRSSSSAPVALLTTSTDSSSNELTTPLLGNDKPDETIHSSTTDEKDENGSLSQAIVTGQQKYNLEDDDDGKPKRIGARARMLGFGKKMGEKLEEKRKHIEERGRLIVERMKEHRQNSGRFSD